MTGLEHEERAGQLQEQGSSRTPLGSGWSVSTASSKEMKVIVRSSTEPSWTPIGFSKLSIPMAVSHEQVIREDWRVPWGSPILPKPNAHEAS